MPKLSVYVPDELWDSVRAGESHLNASQLVQGALRQYLTRERLKPAFAIEPLPQEAEAEKRLSQRLANEARRMYVGGYHTGLELVEESLPWWAIDAFADVNWDFGQWRAWLVESDNSDVDDAIERKLHPQGNPEEPSSTWLLGLTQALRNLWGSVMDAQPTADGEQEASHASRSRIGLKVQPTRDSEHDGAAGRTDYLSP